MESLDPTLEKLLKSFIDLCDTVVENAFVVTNGVCIAGIVLQESLAHHICKKTIDTYKDQDEARTEWVVCKIPEAMRYAFERGFRVAIQQVSMQRTSREESSQIEIDAQENKENSTDEKEKGYQDSKLRDGELQ